MGQCDRFLLAGGCVDLVDEGGGGLESEEEDCSGDRGRGECRFRDYEGDGIGSVRETGGGEDRSGNGWGQGIFGD